VARLAANEVYRQIKPVDHLPALAVLPQLSYVSVGHSAPGKYKCDVVLKETFPPQVWGLIESLDLGGTLARVVIRRLEPRQHIPPHVDDWMPAEADWRRFQVPLVSHPAIRMRWPDDGVEVHLAPGWLYEVRFDRLHEVVNEADVERIHLQVDQVNATI